MLVLLSLKRADLFASPPLFWASLVQIQFKTWKQMSHGLLLTHAQNLNMEHKELCFCSMDAVLPWERLRYLSTPDSTSKCNHVWMPYLQAAKTESGTITGISVENRNWCFYFQFWKPWLYVHTAALTAQAPRTKPAQHMNPRQSPVSCAEPVESKGSISGASLHRKGVNLK